MDREITIGNRIIHQRMYTQERKRHLQRLEDIRNKSSFSIHEARRFRSTTHCDAEKYLEIQRNNIKLFNRIASIIREKPKQSQPKSRVFVKSIGEAQEERSRIQLDLRERNSRLSRRIVMQQPTIKNSLFFKERLKNQRYLRQIARYPITRQSNPNEIVLWRKKGDQFDMLIVQKQNGERVFIVKDIAQAEEHRVMMGADMFEGQLQKYGMDYETLLGNLRMTETGEMYYQMEETSENA